MQEKLWYRDKSLRYPGPIMTDHKYVYVSDGHTNTIHRVSENGQLLVKYILSSGIYTMFYDGENGDLYTAREKSNKLTVYKMAYPHQTDVPIEILKMEERSIQLFQEALKDGERMVHSIHVMVIGSISTGKSTLIKRLIGGKVNMSEKHTTKAIDVHCCDVSLSTGAWRRQTKDLEHFVRHNKCHDLSSAINQDTEEHACLMIWDIPGQCAFYAAHQPLLTRQAIYVLLFDVSDDTGKSGKVHELVEVWLNSIHSCTSSQEAVIPSVILVGTHVDKLSQDKQHEICARYFGEIRSYLKEKPTKCNLIDEDFVIDTTVVHSTCNLKRKIVEVASQQPYWVQMIPARWLPLQNELMRQKANGVKEISHDGLMRINKKQAVQIKPNEELDLFLSFLHETGIIIYCSNEKSKGNIVLDPTWTLINDAHSDSPPVGVSAQKWSDYTDKGLLSSDVIDAVWTKEKYPELHAHKGHMLSNMKKRNVIAKPRAFSEIGVAKIKDHFLVPSKLRQKVPKKIIPPEQEPLIVSTRELCCIFTGKISPVSIFHSLIAACATYWPIAKKKSKNLIFYDFCIFNLDDLFHRLILHYKDHTIFARVTRLVDEVKALDAKLCSRVRKFITLNLKKITANHGQNLQYELHSWWSTSQAFSADGRSAPFHVWFMDEEHDPDSPITPDHINHARLCIAIVTVCGKAMRDVLSTNVPTQYTDIYQAILAGEKKLTGGNRRPLNPDQVKLVYPDPQRTRTGKVEEFDLSLLYILIRNVSSVAPQRTGWAKMPQDQPRDKSLGASMERIRNYRNDIVGHAPTGRMNEQKFNVYWNKIEAVVDDIDQALGKKFYREQLERQRRQVISVYEAHDFLGKD